MDTSQLVRRVQNGDEKALNELYYNCYKQAYTVALMLTKSEPDSYDIMQDSFLSAFLSIHLLKDKSKFLKYLNGFFVKKCREYFSRVKDFQFFNNLTMASGKDCERFTDKKDFSPESDIDYTRGRHIVSELLNDLPADQELIILARYAMKMSPDELAEALKVEKVVIISSLIEGENKLFGQARLLNENGMLNLVPANQIISFAVWMTDAAASDAAVHQMAPAVKKAVVTNSMVTIAADPDDFPQTKVVPSESSSKLLKPKSEPHTKVNKKENKKTRKTSEPAVQVISEPNKTFQPVSEGIPARQEPVTRPNEKSPNEIDDGFSSSEEKITPISTQTSNEPSKKKTKHTARIIIIVVAAVVAMIIGALAFIAFALPNITGQSNPISEIFTGKKEPEYTPEKLVAKYEEAFNAGDRDGVAKLYLPDQSLQRNLQGGAYEMVQKISDNMLGEKIKIKCELKDDLKYDGDTATGTVKVTLDLPEVNGQDTSFFAKLFGIETEKDKPVTFEKYTDGNWYFKEF